MKLQTRFMLLSSLPPAEGMEFEGTFFPVITIGGIRLFGSRTHAWRPATCSGASRTHFSVFQTVKFTFLSRVPTPESPPSETSQPPLPLGTKSKEGVQSTTGRGGKERQAQETMKFMSYIYSSLLSFVFVFLLRSGGWSGNE